MTVETRMSLAAVERLQ